MFIPEEIEMIPEEIIKLFKQLEYDIMTDIIRRIRLSNEITRSADYQFDMLNKLGVSKMDVKKKIQETLKLSNKQIDTMYENVIRSGYSRDKQLYEASGKEYIPFDDNKSLQKLIKAVSLESNNELLNITKTLGFISDLEDKKPVLINEYFKTRLNQASIEVLTGAFDINTSMNKVIDDMTKSGVRVIDYESGRHNRIETAVRSAILGGVNQVTNKIAQDNMDNLNTNYAEVSYHSTARPTHQIWQGRVFTKDELVSICGLGTVTGLLGVNCYHHYDVFLPGISKRNYTDDELDILNKEANKLMTYKGIQYTKYEATQKQRELERSLRASKQKLSLMKDINIDSDTIRNFQSKRQRTLEYYKDFSVNMGLKVQYDRLRIGEFK